MNLSQKERQLLEDEKKHEETCIEKYNKYSSQAKDPALQNLFKSLEQIEQQHLNSINSILSGTVPTMNQSNQNQSNQNQQPMNAFYTAQTQDKQQDAYLCSDALSTEKFISSTYNTTIFECKDTNVRNVINHIQKEEQEHGEKIYNYMNLNSMYN